VRVCARVCRSLCVGVGFSDLVACVKIGTLVHDKSEIYEMTFTSSDCHVATVGYWQSDSFNTTAMS